MSDRHSGTHSDLDPADDAPELTPERAAKAELRVGGRVAREASPPLGRPPMPPEERKQTISIRLSPEVLDHFRATGRGWQTRIDEALKKVVAGQE
ncbi:MAG: BrnA antitoxin family protein [Sphingomonadaceae bacterium]